MANSCFLGISWISRSREDHRVSDLGSPVSASAGDCCPPRRSGRRVPFWPQSLLVKQQLLIVKRSRQRSPDLRLADRLVAGVCALLMRPGWQIRSAIILKPSTLLSLHRALTKRKYRRLFSAQVRKKAGPEGPTHESHGRRRRDETAEPDQRCPRIAQQIAELSPRTLYNFVREFSSLRRRGSTNGYDADP
jgi:hypothetical protein